MRYILAFLFIIFISLNTFASHRINDVVLAIQRIEKSVVNIRTEKIIKKSFNPFFNDPFFDDFFGFERTYKTQSLGSGFFVDDNIIVTNYHVIEAANKIFIIPYDNEQYEAELIGGDKLLDIALLKIKANKIFPSAKLGNSDNLYLGETVIAMGNPYGLSNSVTTGVISNTKRIIKSDNGFSIFIQTDALINPGNSGGPLINLDAEVIGINSAIYREAQGIGFSTPINVLKRIKPEIIKYKKIRRGFLGILFEEDNDGNLIISSVEKNSNARKSGIKRGDILYSIEDIPVSSKKGVNYILRSYPPNSTIKLVIKRKNDFYKTKLLLTSYPENYGLKIFKELYGLEFVKKREYIVVKKSNIPAYVKRGDVILKVNDKEITNLEVLNEIIINNFYDEINFSIYRNGAIFNILLSL
ncbi:trypsin-like peptidase domain-containing protein [Deferribacter thermophilus]|uniref:trypsin-like peptidase domain-containing protein n=1 Tax=Deferribacter thermophilus TaxID=53573 RepID=UPI003C1D00E3